MSIASKNSLVIDTPITVKSVTMAEPPPVMVAMPLASKSSVVTDSPTMTMAEPPGRPCKITVVSYQPCTTIANTLNVSVRGQLFKSEDDVVQQGPVMDTYSVFV